MMQQQLEYFVENVYQKNKGKITNKRYQQQRLNNYLEDCLKYHSRYLATDLECDKENNHHYGNSSNTNSNSKDVSKLKAVNNIYLFHMKN